jgi:hypothetical protein
MTLDRTPEALRRRTVLQALIAIPAFALFRNETADMPVARADGYVVVNGWVLKRSEVA